MVKNKLSMNKFYLPLMSENIDKGDINSLIEFLSQDEIPKLTNGPKVKQLEKEWGEWLGTDYNVMVSSGSAANELTMLALKYLYGDGEVILPPLTWISDISSVIFSGLKPVFIDINLKNFAFDMGKLEEAITPNTKAIFLTHVLGINGLTDKLLELCKENGILLIEDACESHGATFKGKKVGAHGYASNFSFYFAHHMSTIEGGMVCTNDERFYQICKALRSHGMMREITNENMKNEIINDNVDLNEDFIFINPAHNFRSNELNAVVGLSQIKKLDSNNAKRISNFDYFMSKLDSGKYITDIEMDGQCNYAFIVVLQEASLELRDRVEKALGDRTIEFRRGLSGGGNQLRQPYFKKNYNFDFDNFKNVDHVHSFGWYIGNYPSLEREKIDTLIELLNNIE
jgi:CDP-6-deoxy-D-xylo-4-hexulose-3-dehydrase